MKELRYTLGMGCLNAWLWLVFRSGTRAQPLLFNDEFGPLFAVPLCAAFFLMILGVCWRSLGRPDVLARLWPAACACMMTPALTGMGVPFFSGGIATLATSCLAGFGFAVGFLILGTAVTTLSRPGLLFVVSAGIITSRALILGLLLLPPESLFLLPVIFAMSAKLLLAAPTARDDSASVPDANWPVSGTHWRLVSLYITVGFSLGLYYSLLAAMDPLLPRPKPQLLAIVTISCLSSALCIHLARRAFIWWAILLTGPLLVVGYTAWPLVNRESPALSLDSLHFAYPLLAVYCYTTLFYAASRANTQTASSQRLIGLGGGTLLLGILLGTYALPGIRTSLSQGTTVNYLFAFLAFTILLSSFAFISLLERLGFWKNRQMPYQPEPAGHAESDQSGVEPPLPAHLAELLREAEGSDELDSKQYQIIFRNMGLTRQQTLVAAMLAQKHADADICDELNISSSTLKTHVRNILRRLGINSRHELPWLASHAPRTAARHLREQ